MDLTNFGMKVITKDEKYEKLKDEIGYIEASKVAYKPDKLEKVKLHGRLHKNELAEIHIVLRDENDLDFLKTHFFINSISQIKESSVLIDILKNHYKGENHA